MRFKLYPSRRGVLLRKQWRWKLLARNGRTIATSGESYNNRGDCLSAIESIRAEAAQAKVLP